MGRTFARENTDLRSTPIDLTGHSFVVFQLVFGARAFISGTIILSALLHRKLHRKLHIMNKLWGDFDVLSDLDLVRHR